MYEERSGWVTFAGVLLVLAGALNVIYGIAAIGNSKFFVANTKFIFSDLKTWGWITLIIGILQVLAAGSLWAGGLYGRIVGIGAAGISAIAALLVDPGLSVLVAGDLRARHRDHPPDRDPWHRGPGRGGGAAGAVGDHSEHGGHGGVPAVARDARYVTAPSASGATPGG